MSNYQFNPDMYHIVAKNVKKYREQKGFSICDLAKYTEIRKTFLEKFENANEIIPISIYDLYKISVVLDISIDQFFIIN